MQEDFEAEAEMHQLFSSEFSNQHRDTTSFDSISSSSDSSFENEFYHTFGDANSQEN